MAFVTYAPLLLFSLAAFTKAAQMPFQSWLLGAMVAPTPTSALLHSSTMVKAGVFLLIKISPCLGFTIPGFLVMTVGIATFLFCALAAISQSNAKRVLAYSTISNLGLIVACAGVGTDGAIWAAIFLLIFHAVAKSLLFLCVGTAEHHIGSRNIEDMDDLFERMPRLARLMAIGIMGMFIAPFGMLVSKWRHCNPSRSPRTSFCLFCSYSDRPRPSCSGPSGLARSSPSPITMLRMSSSPSFAASGLALAS